jgi:methylphosphotriester-DNA--protein-cysteine methyltransferase
MPNTPELILTAAPGIPQLPEAGYRETIVESWGELITAIHDVPAASAVLADPYMDTRPGTGPSPGLLRAIAYRPSLPVVAMMRVRSSPADVSVLLEWRVSGILDLDLHRSAESVAEVLRDAHARPFKRMAERYLHRRSETAKNLVRAACEVAAEHGGAAELAQKFGVAPTTVKQWCRREGLPAPRRLLAWARVLLAAMLLREEGRSVASAGRAAGYASDHALRRALTTFGAGNPSSTPRAQHLPRAAAAFSRDLREAWRRRAARSTRSEEPS